MMARSLTPEVQAQVDAALKRVDEQVADWRWKAEAIVQVIDLLSHKQIIKLHAWMVQEKMVDDG